MPSVPIAFDDPQVKPHLERMADEYRRLLSLQDTAFDRCRKGDKPACTSVLFLELFLRAAREGRQMTRLVQDLDRF